MVPRPADRFSGEQLQNSLLANWLGNVRVRREDG
jgi:hypothetical protein